MQVTIIAIFPGFFASCLGEGLLGKAADKGLVEVRVDDLRDGATDKHRTVDDAPYGGGPGMVMKVDVWSKAIERARKQQPGARVILLSPQGATLNEQTALRLAREDALVLCCGRYEGVDERVAERLVDEQISIGDYVLTGGEAAALVVLDAVARKLPGVVGKAESVDTDSFTAGLKFPQYTRPPDFAGWAVPEILLSGDHAAIEKWRQEQARLRTAGRRPEMAPAAVAGQVRLLLQDPDFTTVRMLAPAIEAYGLRELAVRLTDAKSRERLRAEALPKVRVISRNVPKKGRNKSDVFIHLADKTEPGQAPPEQIRRILADAAGEVTVSWQAKPPAGAVVAAPLLPAQAGELIAFFAWLDRLFGRGEKGA